MNVRNSLIPMLALALGASFAACSNPAADAPAAEVGESTTPPGVTAPSSQADATTYTLTDDSKIEWTASKVTKSHDGEFPDVVGTISLVGGTPEGSSIEVTIDTTSVTSDADKLTQHLKSADFFDVETYPQATFRSTAITTEGDGSYRVTGDLEMHGVTRQVSFPATIEVEGDTIRADAEFSIDRYDWEIDYKGAADDLIRDEVLLRLDLQASRAAAAMDQTGG